MTKTTQVRGGKIPCRDEARAGTSYILFARVARRLGQLVLVSTGRAADVTFDALLCPLPAGHVTTWQPRVRFGHWAAFTFYSTRAFAPLHGLYTARVRSYGTALPQAGNFSWQRVNSAEGARDLLAQIGLPDIRVYTEQLGYSLHSAGAWWDVVSNSSIGQQVEHLPIEQRNQLRAEHLAEVSALIASGPIWVELPVIFAIGRRPQS